MWSTIKKPGCKKSDADTSRWVLESGTARTNLTERSASDTRYIKDRLTLAALPPGVALSV
jgi:hypothetical protein